MKKGWENESERHGLASHGIHTTGEKQQAISNTLKNGVSVDIFISNTMAKGYTEQEARMMLSVTEKAGKITIKDNKIFLSPEMAKHVKTEFINSKV